MSTDICRWLFLLFCLTTWTTSINSKEIRVVCYYTNWSVYRPGTAKFSPQNINPYLCTHLVYAFGGFTKENTLKPFDKYQDIEKGGYAKFTGLKTYNKNLKTMLAIGGWNEGSSRFSPMVANAERRKELVKNAVKFLRQNHFDGLDLDWEYPSFRDGGKARDRDNYAKLVQELREEFDRESEKTGRPRLLLTMAVPAGIEYINKGYDVPKLTKYLDWMNILSYDYHSAFEPAVNHHAPLYSLEEASEYNYDTELNIDYTIQHYLELGADPSKLVMGIPTYGRSYTLFNPDASDIGAPADGPGDMGEATRENGYLAYYEICDYVKSQDWEVVQPNPTAMGPYAYKDNQWVSYDDDGIARKKAEYVAKNGLGGIMFWSIDNDDFRGSCHGKPYPIIEAAKEALIQAFGLTDENLVNPPPKPLKPQKRPRPQTKVIEEEKSVSNTLDSSRRRNKNKPKPNVDNSSNSRAKNHQRKNSRRTTQAPVHSSLELVTPSYTTPAPPATPDQGGVFKCEDEGFFPHPKDCKKYYWCLSGPGELGIIAHQFTCPAGLYFNKAADSCDYTRNVLCNKKLSKGTSTTSTSTESSSTSTTSTSTARVPPKITAATSRTTVFRTSTTTASYDDEYEYEEEDFEDNKNSEEDPRVIKELLDLIKKAGGIEELEKQLKFKEDGSASVSSSDATTPPSISKSLVERVLGKAAKNKKNSFSFLNRNSRGPQNQGLSKEDIEDKARPQYTTIARQRPSKQSDNDDAEEDNVDDNKSDKAVTSTSNKKQPEYVNIRRARVSSTTVEPSDDEKEALKRNKILGEIDDEEALDNDDDNEEEEVYSNKRKTASPQYVNIRRQRPSSTEETPTSKYSVIRRGSSTDATETEENNPKKRNESQTTKSESDIKSKYTILRRGSTTASPIEEESNETNTKTRGSTNPKPEEPSDDTFTIKSRRRGTTTAATTDVSDDGKRRRTTTSSTTEETTSASNEKYKTLRRGSTTTESIPLGNETSSNDESTLRYSPSPLSSTSTTPDSAKKQSTLASDVEISTDNEQILTTNPEILNINTSASLSTETATLSSRVTESNDENEFSSPEKRPPLLLEPRPFSLSTNGPSSSVKPVTETTTRITKVSEQNYKLRVRPKVQSLQSDSTSTTEKISPRTRAPSRFKQPTEAIYFEQQTVRPTVHPSGRTRKRFSTTTELYSDSYDEYDINRSYRPSEIADLSSLTAVDFAAFKELNKFNGGSRSRRPRPSTVLTTTTEKSEERLKTSSRTLPLARKLLDPATFGKSRRIILNKPEESSEDQINASSDTTQKIRGFTRASTTLSSTTEIPNTDNSKPTLRSRKVIRRFRTTTTQPISSSNETILEDTSENAVKLSSGFRRRIVRPQPTTSSTTVTTEKLISVSENLVESASTHPLFNRKFTKPVISSTSRSAGVLSSEPSFKEENEEQNETSDDVSNEEGENIKLSESNIRENSNVNNHNILEDGKKIRTKVLKRVKSKVDDVIKDSIAIEKPSTEPNVIIRTRKIIRKLKPTESSLSINITETSGAITTPGITNSTIETATPVISSTESSDVSTLGRKRKIIRRLRPTTETTNILSSETTSSSVGTTTANKRLLFRNKSPASTTVESDTSTNSTSEIEETKIGKEESSKFKPSGSKFKYKPLSSRTTTQSTDESIDEKTVKAFKPSKYKPIARNPEKSSAVEVKPTINRSRYNTVNRGTPSTTTRSGLYSRTTPNHDQEYDDEEEEDIEEIEDEIQKPVEKYRIFRPIITRQQDGDSGDKDPKIRIYRPNINEGNDEIDDDYDNYDTEDEANEDENKRGRIFSPNLKKLDKDIKEKIPPLRILNPSVNETVTEETEILRPTLNKEDELESDEKEDSDEAVDGEEQEEDNDEQINTTIRNYKNPILERQKKRPTFVKPKLSTQNPLSSSSTTAKSRFKQFSRSTTPSSKTSESTIEITNLKTYDRSLDSAIGVLNESENSTTITELNKNTSDASSGTTTEFYYVTEHVTDTDNDVNITTTEADVEAFTSIKNLDITESKNSTLSEITNSTINDTNDTVNDILTTIRNEILNDTTDEYDVNNVTENAETTTIELDVKLNETAENEITTEAGINTTVSNTPYVPRSTLRSIQDRPKYTGPKRPLTQTESSSTTVRSPVNRFSQRNRGQLTPKPLIRSTPPANPSQNRLNLFKYSTTEKDSSKFGVNKKDDNSDDDNEEDYEDDIDDEEPAINSKPIIPSLRFTPSPNKFRFSTTERSRFIANNVNNKKINDAEESEDEYEEEGEELEDEEENRKAVTPRNNFTPRTTKSRPRVSNRPGGFSSFKKTTEIPQIKEDLSDVNKEAVKTRNKSLFSKRKMNTPFAGSTPTYSATTEEKSTSQSSIASEPSTQSVRTTTPLITESVTKPSTIAFETTEYLTTLHHVFAETEPITDKMPTSTNGSSSDKIGDSKVERLIEVNRIVEVHEKNKTDNEKDNKIIDKVGVINRVKVVQIVDSNPSPEENEITESISTTQDTSLSASTKKPEVKINIDGAFIIPEIATVREIPNPQAAANINLQDPLLESINRDDRKYEIYGKSKVELNTNIKKGGAEIIDGISHINIITPRPYYSTEASTIALQGLFQTDTPQKLNNINVNLLKTSSGDDELLETGNSRFVNVRLLGQEDEKDHLGEVADTNIVPVRVLKQDEDITMKAQVVEVTPKNREETIKIVPIKVEMARKLF